jgi:hypothetical protein
MKQNDKIFSELSEIVLKSLPEQKKQSALLLLRVEHNHSSSAALAS